MDYYQKYIKYKTKYLNLLGQTGGDGYNKYILLSCPEFNKTINNVILSDGENLSINGLAFDQAVLDGEMDDANAIIPANLNNFQKFCKSLGHNYDTLAAKPQLFTKLKLEFLRKINEFESKNFYRGFIYWNSYPDKSPDIKLDKKTITKLRGSKIIYLAYFSFNEPNATSIVDQLLFLNSLSHYGVSQINIVLPYFPVGTMERIVGEGEVPTGYSFAHLLNNIPSGAYKNNIYIFDIHALCSRFFFHTETRPILVSMMPKILKTIDDSYLPTVENKFVNIIVYPDDGAKKRFEKLIPSNYLTITCGKERKGNDRVIKIESGLEHIIDIAGGQEQGLIKDNVFNLFVIDDLIQSGGTVIKTFEGIHTYLETKATNYAEKKADIKNIPVVTHSVFPTDANLDNFLKPDSIIDKFLTTDSRPFRIDNIQSNRDYNAKTIVLPIADVITDIFKNPSTTEYIAPYILN